MINGNGKLVLYSGSSGVGKGTILEKLRELDGNVWVSVSNTTRAPRVGEVDGQHYHFISREAFEKLIAEDGYLEYAEYCGNYYGTPLQALNEKLAEGRTVFLEIEVEGALQVMKKCPGVISIFIVPPSFEELEKRLRSRGTEDGETIEKRLEKAKEEIGCRGRYTYNVINDDLDTAVQEVYDIIHGNI
ncbi:MAG: guanylate kinase [Ruminococcus sp.]